MSVHEAVRWLHSHQQAGGALPVSSADRRPHPEVTAYCLPTLWRAGQPEMAERGLRWLLECQTEDGYWPGPDMRAPYWFDTAIVAGSLLEMVFLEASWEGRCRPAIERALVWLERACPEHSACVQTEHHDPAAPAEINLLGLAMLHSESPVLATVLHRWLGNADAVSCQGKMQHFYCYVVDAVARVNRQWAWQIAAKFARAQALDGSLAAYYDDVSPARVRSAVSWRCYPAVAQWAALWARLGYREPARRAVSFLHSRLTPYGGLTGGDGPYFPAHELTWAVKYYVDARLSLADRGDGRNS